jgi:hypothetical protein
MNLKAHHQFFFKGLLIIKSHNNNLELKMTCVKLSIPLYTDWPQTYWRIHHGSMSQLNGKKLINAIIFLLAIPIQNPFTSYTWFWTSFPSSHANNEPCVVVRTLEYPNMLFWSPSSSFYNCHEIPKQWFFLCGNMIHKSRHYRKQHYYIYIYIYI